MQKFYIPIGAASLQPPAGDYQECYDASDVDERIARLERDLADAKTLIASLGRSNDRLRQKLDDRTDS
jgi:hypothetical protein